MEGALRKVTAFITRQASAGSELLVFQHPSAGVQLPAGTVDPEEDYEVAVFREVAEETGLADVRLKRCLGEETLALEADVRVLLTDTAMARGPGAQADGFALRRGCWLAAIAAAPGFVEVRVDEINTNVAPAQVLKRFSGWVPENVLGSVVVRRFYQFEHDGKTPDRWAVEGEPGLTFECYWVPLTPLPTLHPAQQGWINAWAGALESG